MSIKLIFSTFVTFALDFVSNLCCSSVDIKGLPAFDVILDVTLTPLHANYLTCGENSPASLHSLI